MMKIYCKKIRCPWRSKNDSVIQFCPLQNCPYMVKEVKAELPEVKWAGLVKKVFALENKKTNVKQCRWTNEEKEKLKEMRSKGYTHTTIAVKFNRTKGAVEKKWLEIKNEEKANEKQ